MFHCTIRSEVPLARAAVGLFVTRGQGSAEASARYASTRSSRDRVANCFASLYMRGRNVGGCDKDAVDCSIVVCALSGHAQVHREPFNRAGVTMEQSLRAGVGRGAEDSVDVESPGGVPSKRALPRPAALPQVMHSPASASRNVIVCVEEERRRRPYFAQRFLFYLKKTKKIKNQISNRGIVPHVHTCFQWLVTRS